MNSALKRDRLARVILSAGNITHYHYAAIALNKHGYLNRYLFSFACSPKSYWWLRLLPDYWQKKMRGREISGDITRCTKYSPLSEIVSHGLVHNGFISNQRGNWLFNEMYDRSMLRWIYGSDIFHFVSSVGLLGARHAKKNGNILICDMRSAHPNIEWSLLEHEYATLGIHYYPDGFLTEKRVKEEISLSDYFIVPSNYVAETLTRNKIDRDRIFIIPYGVNINRFNNQQNNKNYRKNSFNILFVGQIGVRKGVHYLLKAFNKFNDLNACLLMVGSIEEGFKDYFNSWLKLDKRIQHLGHVPHVDLHNYYQQASVFIIPSLSEGSALVVYEAMAEGVPVITTKNAGSIITNMVDGILVPICDDEAILSKLIWLRSNPQKCLELGLAGLQNIRLYSWDNYGDRLLSVYKQIISMNKL